MEEFTSRPLFHSAGAPLDLRQCCDNFQSWLDSFEQPTVSQIVADARTARELAADQKDLLAARVERWLTRPYYLDFLLRLRMEAIFFDRYLERSLPLSAPLAVAHDEAHYRKYQFFAFCAFLGFFRSTFNWQEDSEQRKLATAVFAAFRRIAIAKDKGQWRISALRKFIALFFDLRQELISIARQMDPQAGQRGAIRKEHRDLVLRAQGEEGWSDLPWDERVEYLDSLGVLYQKKALNVAYRKNPSGVRRTLQRIK